MQNSNSTNDILYNCANSYKQLIGTDYVFELGDKYREIILSFDESHFLHLTSINKLKDLSEIKGASSSHIFNLILNKKLTYDRLTESEQFAAQKYPAKSAEGIANNVEYTLKDRLTVLTDLFDNLNSINNEKGSPNVDIFQWQTGVFKENERPYHSKISADILIEFKDTIHKKVLSERTCLFLKDDCFAKGFVADSIFPSDVTFSDDGKKHVEQYKILSISKCKANDKSNVISLIKGNNTEIEKAKEMLKLSDAGKTIKNDMKKLQSKRKAYFDDIDNPKTLKSYKNQINIFKNQNIYKDFMLEKVLESLNSQLSSSHNSEVADLIRKEIKSVEEEIVARRVQPNKSENEKQGKTTLTVSASITNPDGTKSIKVVKTIETPNIVNNIRNFAERKAHTIKGSLESTALTVLEKIKAFVSTSKQTLPLHIQKKPQKSQNGIKSQTKSKSQKRTGEDSLCIKASTKQIKHSTPQKVSPTINNDKPSVFKEVEKIKAQQKNEPQKPVPAKSRNNNIDIDD